MRSTFLIAIALAGCAEPPLGFRVQPQAGLDAPFEAAAAAWCVAADCCPYVDRDGPSVLRYERPGELDAYPPVGERADADAIATRRDTGETEILVSLDAPSDRIPAIVLHELGHACGCGHETGNPNDVMHGDRSGAATLSAADIECVQASR